jgi:hypothetical protein
LALNFPSSPAVGQVYSAEGADFVWSGAVWVPLDGSNFPYATQAEALAGTRTDRAMSPLTTEQAIAARNFQPSEGYGIPVNVAAQRAEGATYANNTGRNLFWAFEGSNDVSCVMRVAPTTTMVDFTIARLLAPAGRNGSCGLLIVPPTWRYRLQGVGVTFARWWEW